MSRRVINEVEGFTLNPFKDFSVGDSCVIQGVSFTEMNITEGRLALLRAVCLCHMFMTVSRQMDDHNSSPG